MFKLGMCGKPYLVQFWFLQNRLFYISLLSSI